MIIISGSRFYIPTFFEFEYNRKKEKDFRIVSIENREYYMRGERYAKSFKRSDKPIFLSIGYSTCHWCHVMAHESFEDEKIAGLLNKYFISIKVDKEERPDIDSIYMAVCQTFTGNGKTKEKN